MDTLLKAEKVFGRNFPIPAVLYDVKGCVAGYYTGPARNSIRINPILFQENQEDYLQNTIPHEIGHLVTDHICINFRHKPHGPEWKSVMVQLGLPPIVCHNYDTSSVASRPRQTQKFTYECSCGPIHKIGKNKHTKVLKGQIRRCLRCHEQIRYTGYTFLTNVDKIDTCE